MEPHIFTTHMVPKLLLRYFIDESFRIHFRMEEVDSRKDNTMEEKKDGVYKLILQEVIESL
jgi:hypothetical protein